jgi:hypothetical protein
MFFSGDISKKIFSTPGLILRMLQYGIVLNVSYASRELERGFDVWLKIWTGGGVLGTRS